MGANARGVAIIGRVFVSIMIAGSLGASAWAVRPRDTGPSAEKRIASSRGNRTGVAVQGGVVRPESRSEFDELRVIVRADGGPMIVQPPGPAAAMKALRDERLAALEQLAGKIVHLDNQVRRQHGRPPRALEEVVARRYTHVFNGLAVRIHRESLPHLSRLPGVTGVWVDQEVHAALAESVPLIRADQVWAQLGFRGQDVAVAVIDTGIDYTRPDLGGCFGDGCKVTFGYDLSNNDADPMDDYGHGTHVAGIIAADGAVKGVAPRATLWAFKVLDQYGSGWDSTIIAGIEMATNPDGDPATQDGAQVINLSLGGSGDPDDAMSQAVDNAMAGGTMVVVAAGNSGPDFDTLGSPGCARQVLTVGASDKTDQMAWFSSRGPAPTTWQIKPEVIAPGVDILSTVPTGTCTLCDPSGYLALNGTSMATPHVAGVAALIRERYPQWTPAQVKAAIMQRTLDFSYGAFVQGAGRLDAWNAITPQALVDPPSASLGLDDPALPSFSRSQSFTVTNLGGSQRSYALTVDATVPAGISATVTPTTLTVPGHTSRTFMFTVTVDNPAVANVPIDPFSYEGTIRAASATETLHVPFAFLKAPTLTLAFDQMAWTVTVSDNASWWRYFQYPPTTLSILVPDTIVLDVVTLFPDAVSYVLHEGLHVTTNMQVSVARAEAVYPFTIVPVDKNGATLPLTTSMTLVHLGPKSHYFDMYTLSDFGGTLGSPTVFYLSSMSPTYDFDVSVLQEPGGTSPTYFYYGHTGAGVHGPMTFRNTAADFRHVLWHYEVGPGHSVAFPVTWVSARPFDTPAIISFGACDANPGIPPPFQRDVYLTPLPSDQVGSGFLTQWVFGTTPSSPCNWTDFLFTTPYVAARSVTELDTWAAFDPVPLVRTNNLVLPSGLGPYHWNGTMANAPDALFAYGASGPWFVSQMHDVRTDALSYELTQSGTILQAGGLGGNQVLQLPVVPGRYALHIPYTPWSMGGAPARSDAFASFDTAASDPNPPTLSSLMLEHAGAFVDRLPADGGTVTFRAGDESGLVDARLYYKTAGGYAPAIVSGDVVTGFTAAIPPPGGPAPTGPVALVLKDGSGNALTFGYCSASSASAEICDGFDDDCDGALLPGETDLDGDAWSACAGDCDDANALVWGAPGETPGVAIGPGSVLTWDAPISGAMPAAMRYDVLRSADPSDFTATATCVASQSSDLTASDTAQPPVGTLFFYQVRASDACPDGAGSLGSRSDGTPRAGRACP